MRVWGVGKGSEMRAHARVLVRAHRAFIVHCCNKPRGSVLRLLVSILNIILSSCLQDKVSASDLRNAVILRSSHFIAYNFKNMSFPSRNSILRSKLRYLNFPRFSLLARQSICICQRKGGHYCIRNMLSQGCWAVSKTYSVSFSNYRLI
jgi:hypothetical protein